MHVVVLNRLPAKGQAVNRLNERILKPFRHRENRTALDRAHKITIQHSLQGINAATKELHRTASKGKVTQSTKELHNAATKEQCNNSPQGSNTTQPQGEL